MRVVYALLACCLQLSMHEYMDEVLRELPGTNEGVRSKNQVRSPPVQGPLAACSHTAPLHACLNWIGWTASSCFEC